MKTEKKTVLALGSNVGNRRENLVRAVAEIEKFARVLSRSKIYETAPEGFENQRDFLNAALFCETHFDPAELLKFCKETESLLGRTPNFKDGPREIDIDIIFFEGENFESPNLQIPHPRWSSREFVISPLLDLVDARFSSIDFCCDVHERLKNTAKKFLPFSSF